MAESNIQTITFNDVSGLSSQVMFLQLRAGLLGNSRKMGGDIFNTPGTDVAWLSANKKLLESPQLDAIRKADMRIRQWLYNSKGPALPCSFDAFTIPNGSVVSVRNKLEEFKTERAGLVDEFMAVYVEQSREAREKLGPQWNPHEYLTPERVRAKFYFEYSFYGFGVSETLKEISQELYDEQKNKIESDFRNAADEITAVMRETAFGLLQNLQEQLTPDDTTGKAKKLHPAALANVKNFLESFSIKNVTNDNELSNILAQVKTLVTGVDTKTIKASESFKTNMRDKLAEITGKLSTMVEEKSGRKFLFDE